MRAVLQRQWRLPRDQACDLIEPPHQLGGEPDPDPMAAWARAFRVTVRIETLDGHVFQGAELVSELLSAPVRTLEAQRLMDLVLREIGWK